VVVDNCSTDDTAEILAPLVADGRIKFHRNDKNYERAHSRNVGMSIATGDFLTLLDSDDFLYPTFLDDARQFHEANPSIKVFHSLYELVTHDRKVLRRYTFPALDDRLKAIASGNFLSCIGDFIHRDVYANYSFDTFEPLTGAEDWDFWLRVVADYELGRIEKVNCGIQHHDQRTVRSKHFEKLETGYEHMFKKFRDDAHLMEVYGKYIDEIEAASYQYLAILANSNGYFGDAFRYLKEAARRGPRHFLTSRYLRILRRTAFRIAD
jgi:glycosyltransferase involved in cell wall biosynthesis